MLFFCSFISFSGFSGTYISLDFVWNFRDLLVVILLMSKDDDLVGRKKEKKGINRDVANERNCLWPHDPSKSKTGEKIADFVENLKRPIMHGHTQTYKGLVGWPRRARIQPAKRWADGPNKRVEYNFCATGRPKFSMQFLSFSSNNIWAKRVVLVLRSILLSRNIEIIDNRIIFGELDAKMLVKWFFKEKNTIFKISHILCLKS